MKKNYHLVVCPRFQGQLIHSLIHSYPIYDAADGAIPGAIHLNAPHIVTVHQVGAKVDLPLQLFQQLTFQ